MSQPQDVDPDAPETIIAQDFMRRKGYPHIFPYEVEPLEGQDCWYFYYELPEGDLELEVSWDAKRGIWDTLVTSFRVLE